MRRTYFVYFRVLTSCRSLGEDQNCATRLKGMDQAGSSGSDWYQSPSDSEGAKPPTKRVKGKSKVWEKVAWFTRRSRSRDGDADMVSLPDGTSVAALPPDVMDIEISPLHLPMSFMPDLHLEPPWIESSSSGDEHTENGERTNSIRKSPLYPNSEIDEQSCLKPSVARALFHQMEAARMNNKPPKFTKPRKKKLTFSNSLDIDRLNPDPNSAISDNPSLPASFSVPKELVLASQLQPKPNFARLCKHKRSVTRDIKSETYKRPLVTDFVQNNDNLNRPSLHRHSSFDEVMKINKSLDNEDIQQTAYEGIKFNSLPTHYSLKNWYKTTKSHLAFGQSLFYTPPRSRSSICKCDQSNSNFEEDSEEMEEDELEENTHHLSPSAFKNRNNNIQEWFSECNDEQKNIILKGLLTKCGLPQMHLLSTVMAPRLHTGCPPNCQDMLSWLPVRIATYIMSFLDPVSLCQASQVCKRWSTLSNEPCLWRHHCSLPQWRLSMTGEQKQLINNMLKDGSVHWKKTFAERYQLRNNWLRGRCNVRTFEGHTQGISCVQFDDTRIVSGSSDKTIKVWNIRTNTPWSVQTLVGHSGTVRCLHLDGNRLVSGSTDRTIKVWDLSTQQSWSSIACRVTMIGHTDTVRCLQVDDEKAISGSYDKTLKIWDIKNGQCKRSLRGHDAAVLCVQFDDMKIVSGSADKTIKLWNFIGECLMSLEGHQDAVTCLQFDNTRIISGSLDCNLMYWDINTGECVKTIDWKAAEGHTRVVRCLQADSWRLVSASDDRTLKVWNLETGKRLVTLRNHTDGVTCLQFNDSIIVSGSYDKTVKLWDFNCC